MPTLVAGVLLATSTLHAGELTGRVVHENRPVLGARVVAVPYESPFAVALRETRGLAAPTAVATITTGQDGSFKVVIPPTAPPVALRVEFGGLGKREVEGVFESADTEDLGEISLSRGENLGGRVVDAAQKPVAGAQVRIGRDGPLTTTGPDGLFHFDDLDRRLAIAGPLALGGATPTLSVTAAGFESTAVAARFSGPPVTVKLKPAAVALTGSVKMPDGRPAEGALVRFVVSDIVSRYAVTDAQGKFRIDGVPAGQGRVSAMAKDGAQAEVTAQRGATLALTLARAASIAGRIIDSETGKAVSGVKVTARTGRHRALARSGADGRYRVSALGKASYAVTFDEKKYVLLDRAGIELDEGQERTLDVSLVLGATLVGRVTDTKGQPVAGAKGRLAPATESRMAMMFRLGPGSRDGREAFVSGLDGSFKASRLAPGANQKLTVSHQEYERRVMPGIDLAVGAKPTSVSVVLGTGYTLEGVVKDNDGKPISGVSVRMSRQAQMSAGRGGNMSTFITQEEPRPSIETDFEGKFAFKGITEGNYDVRFSRAGYAATSQTAVKIGEGTAPLSVTMQPGASISGRILLPNGEAAPNYNVMARPAGGQGRGGMGMFGGPGGAQPGRSGPDGAYLIEGLDVGSKYDLMVFSPTEMRLDPRKRDVVAPATDVDVEVAGRGKIAGRVVNAATGAPITSFEASYSPAQRGMMVVIRTSADDGDRGRRPFSSPDGTFSFEDVPAGNWDVSVWAKTYQDARTSGVAVTAGETKTIEVKASPGLTIRGRVIDARTGRGISEASVSASDADDNERVVVFSPGASEGPLTDVDGRFEITGNGPGLYQLTARHPSFTEGTAQVKLDDRDAAADITLAAGAVAAGVVVSPDGLPIAGANVSLSGGTSGGGFFGAGGQGALTDALGRFRFEHLAAGRYKASAALRSQSAPVLDVVLANGEIREDLRLSLNAGATVRGTIAGIDPAERAGISVSAQGAEDYFGTGRTGPDGTFEFTGVPAGSLRLRATAGDFLSGTTRTATKDVTVPPGETLIQTEVLFDEGLVITGTLMRGGQPVSGANVSAFQQGTGRQGSARTDDNGAFRITGMEAGRVTVFAFSQATSSSVSKSVELAGNTTVDLVMPVARLSGTVVDAVTGLPLAKVSVEVQAAASPQGPRALLRSDTDTSGRFQFDDLEVQAYRLTSRRSGFEFDVREVTPKEEGVDVHVELKRGEGLALEARDGLMGFALRSLFVRVQQGAQDVFMGPVSLDGEGRGEIPGLKPGSYTVTADAAEYAPVRLTNVQAPTTLLHVQLTPGGSVEFQSGEGFLAGGPKSGTLTTATGEPALLGLGFGAGGGPGGAFTLNRQVQRLDNLPPGAYRLTLEGGIVKPFTVTEGGLVRVPLP